MLAGSGRWPVVRRQAALGNRIMAIELCSKLQADPEHGGVVVASRAAGGVLDS